MWEGRQPTEEPGLFNLNFKKATSKQELGRSTWRWTLYEFIKRGKGNRCTMGMFWQVRGEPHKKRVSGNRTKRADGEAES